MNKFYNNDDDFLRNKLVDHEFDALPQAWEQMSALLDSQPIMAKRSAGYYWWGLPIAALIIGAASGIYYYNNQPAVLTTPSVVASQATTPMALQTPVNIDNAPSTVQTSVPTTLQSATTLSTPLATSSTSNNSVATAPSKEAAPTPTTAAIFATVSRSTNTTTATALPTTAKETNSSTSTTAAASSSEEASKNENIEQIISINTAPITTPKILSEEQQHHVIKRRTEIIHQYSTTPLRALQEKRQQELGTFGIKEEVSFKKSPIKFGVVVGASAQMPAISPQKVAFRPVLGAQVGGKFAKHHGIQAGVQYKNLSVDMNPSIAQSSYTGDQNQQTSTAHHIKGIHTLEFPVVYKLHPHPKYNLQAGVKPTVLVGVDSEASKSVNVAPASIGLSSWDLGLTLGAEYAWDENWSVSVQYTLGLMNLAQDAQALHDQQQRNNSLSSDPIPAQAISKENELLIPAGSNQAVSHFVRVPAQIRNSDVQLLLKYTF